MVMVGLATIGKSSCVKTEESLGQSRRNCLQAARTAFAPIFLAFLYPTITTKLPCAPLPLSPRFTPLNTFWALHILVNTIPIAAVCSFATFTLTYIHDLVAATITVNCIAELTSGPWRLAVRAVSISTAITLQGHRNISNSKHMQTALAERSWKSKIHTHQLFTTSHSAQDVGW